MMRQATEVGMGARVRRETMSCRPRTGQARLMAYYASMWYFWLDEYGYQRCLVEMAASVVVVSYYLKTCRPCNREILAATCSVAVLLSPSCLLAMQACRKPSIGVQTHSLSGCRKYAKQYLSVAPPRSPPQLLAFAATRCQVDFSRPSVQNSIMSPMSIRTMSQ